MRHLLIITLLLLFGLVANAQQFIESYPATPSVRASKELANRNLDYEFVGFPINELVKAITKRQNTIRVILGKQIDDVWTVQEDELNYYNLGIDKWDDAGNRFSNVPVCETFSATSQNSNVRVRFTININAELSGFVHDLKTNVMIHFRSISLMTTSKEKDSEKNTVAIYSEKLSAGANQQATSISPPLTPCNTNWLVLAIETDDEYSFSSNVPLASIMQEVDYVMSLNLGMRVYYKKFNWTQGTPGYPYNNVPTIAVPNTSPTAFRTIESDMFQRFIDNGWAKNQICNMGHLLTGRKLRNPLYGNSGGYSNFSSSICGGQLPLSMSSTEYISIEQIARTIVHELGHNLAGDTAHDDNCSTTYNPANPTPNTLMCTYMITDPNSGEGGRGIYFTSNYINNINNKLAPNIGCLTAGSTLNFGQAFYNGVAINSTPYFTSSRNGTLTVDMESFSSASSPSFTVGVTPTSVYLGNPYTVLVEFPKWIGGVQTNAPSNVNNATFNIQASNACQTIIRSIPIVYGAGYRLYPNPT